MFGQLQDLFLQCRHPVLTGVDDGRPLGENVLERLGITDYEELMSSLVDFVALAEAELAEMEDAFK